MGNLSSSYLGEKLVAALHYCAILDNVFDKHMIINEILIPCAKFYDDYCKWEDKNIIEREISKYN